ncbi:MAG: hypothetical protein CVV11_17115 [Gammaproteobacteria bacterium HGW-Gammaproteobacteria-15]|nr:MAG: hypothetical protein CVV11_17115 [Gammaproteobacteria bacterium HGW-Gammaproteobacteria-15]
MSDDQKAFGTFSHKDFYERNGFLMPQKPHINRELFDAKELKCFEDYFVSLCTDLTIYNQLFGSDESISILSDFSGFIFCRIQRNFVEKICLKLACLMDPATSGKGRSNKNLSLKRFVESVDNSELNIAYERLYKSYDNTGIKKWRDKILAHTDLKTAMGEFDFELKFDTEDLNEIIREVQDILDLIKNPDVYTDTTITLPFGKDVASFLSRLKLLNENKDA